MPSETYAANPYTDNRRPVPVHTFFVSSLFPCFLLLRQKSVPAKAKASSGLYHKSDVFYSIVQNHYFSGMKGKSSKEERKTAIPITRYVFSAIWKLPDKAETKGYSVL